MPIHPFASIVLAHCSRYPLMQPADLYKLAHQAALGSEHAIMDEDTARDRLARELAEMGDGPTEPMLDPISADGCLLRVHLRPYLQTGHNPEALFQAFIRSANRSRGDGEQLRSNLRVILKLAKDGRVGIDEDNLIPLYAAMEAAGWPAIHHSREYQLAYRPAYRVVVRDFLVERMYSFGGVDVNP